MPELTHLQNHGLKRILVRFIVFPENYFAIVGSANNYFQWIDIAYPNIAINGITAEEAATNDLVRAHLKDENTAQPSFDPLQGHHSHLLQLAKMIFEDELGNTISTNNFFDFENFDILDKIVDGITLSSTERAIVDNAFHNHIKFSTQSDLKESFETTSVYLTWINYVLEMLSHADDMFDAFNTHASPLAQPIIDANDPCTAFTTVSGKPTNIRQINRTDGIITFDWKKPACTGGSALTGYNVYRKLEPSGTFTNIQTVTEINNPTFTDDTIDNEKSYSYYVKAVNSSGESVESDTILFNPLVIDTEGCNPFDLQCQIDNLIQYVSDSLGDLIEDLGQISIDTLFKVKFDEIIAGLISNGSLVNNAQYLANQISLSKYAKDNAQAEVDSQESP